MRLHEPLENLFTSSKVLVLNFAHIPVNTPSEENIQHFFAESEKQGINPRLPQYRQMFNEKALTSANVRYLVSQYGEDRIAMLAGSHIANEGRTLHIGIDIFARDQESVLAPVDGAILRSGYEPDHGFGYFIILQPEPFKGIYILLGHLGRTILTTGTVKAGDRIGQLGDFVNDENGGWSRHLHLQLLTQLPAEGSTPDGYSTQQAFDSNSTLYPDPMPHFPDWPLVQNS